MSAARVRDGRVAAEVVVSIPKTLTHDAGVAAATRLLENPHVHMVPLVRAGRLVGTIVSDDLPEDCPAAAPALGFARLAGRVVSASDPVEEIRERMLRDGLRRLAVVDDEHRFLGLICLKRDRSGFCTDQGIAARAAEAAAVRGDPAGRHRP